MTEQLEKRVKAKGIKIFDRFLVIEILTDKSESGEARSVGLIALNTDKDELESRSHGITLFNCTNIVFATGGPAAIYDASVYPKSQFGSTGVALRAGVKGVNLTESQYGIASVKFRWNLSGTYQQVLPRYISTNQDMSDEKEFLKDYFTDKGKSLDAIFLKGYQWPFDPRKLKDFASSIIDILVYNETQLKGRRVFLDYTRNPLSESEGGELDFSLLGGETYDYLEKSGALFGTPIERLAKMNTPAIELYKANKIDLYKEYLEIDVCAQHCNGGLLGNIWWESNIRHFFPVGEVNGSFGVYRPGGSALNSTQVGSLRAAQFITVNYTKPPMPTVEFILKTGCQGGETIERISYLCNRISESSNVKKLRNLYKKRMSKCGAVIRSSKDIEAAIEECRKDLMNFYNDINLETVYEIPEAFRNLEILTTQFTMLSAISEYMRKGGRSRGSYLIQDSRGQLPLNNIPEVFRFSLDEGLLQDVVCEAEFAHKTGEPSCLFQWKKVREIPKDEQWFENVWNAFREGNCYK
jgi:succinate dehydrogenase/fumarate reductase flavoprotein subunit